MKTLFALFLLLFLVTACDKPIKSDRQFTELSFVQTTTPKTTTFGQGITSTVRVSGSDLCYSFAYFTVFQQKPFVDIHAIGNYPTEPVACPQAIYYKDTTLTIQPNSTGQYILRFYNGDNVFKQDTVQVN